MGRGGIRRFVFIFLFYIEIFGVFIRGYLFRRLGGFRRLVLESKFVLVVEEKDFLGLFILG